MKKLRIVGNPKSKSASLLATELREQLGYKVFRSRFVKLIRENLIYGDARDKLTQYKYFFENKLNFPWFTESKQEAIDSVDNGNAIVCRTLLRAKGGKGIVIADTVEQIVDAPVYVEYKKKTHEYRVNLFKGQVVCIREKRLKKGYEKPDGRDGRVRNHCNGYVFCEPVDALPEGIVDMAKQAAKITGSDFVGVDVAYHKPTKYLFMLEVNSAPGMEGKTVDQYVDAIIKHFGENNG